MSSAERELSGAACQVDPDKCKSRKKRAEAKGNTFKGGPHEFLKSSLFGEGGNFLPSVSTLSTQGEDQRQRKMNPG